MLDDPKDFPPAFARAWADRDGAAIAALFAEDADFVNVVGIWWERRGDIAKAHDYALKSFFSETTLAVGRVKVRPLGPGAAVVHARFRLSGQKSPTGGEAGARTTILAAVLEKRSGGWLAVAAQNTEVLPGAETFVVGDDGLRAKTYR